MTSIMTYDEAKIVRDTLDKAVSATGKVLKAFPRTGAMNLPTEQVRQSPAYKAAKSAYNQAFSELQAFNKFFVSTFADEYRAERRRPR